MATLFKYVLITIIIFFIWNILKRLFFKTFYANLFEKQQKNENPTNKKENPVKWDAETIDYEEIKSDIKK